MKAYREKQKHKELKRHYQYCSRYYKTQKSECFQDEYELLLDEPITKIIYYNTCNKCRERDKIRRAK